MWRKALAREGMRLSHATREALRSGWPLCCLRCPWGHIQVWTPFDHEESVVCYECLVERAEGKRRRVQINTVVMRVAIPLPDAPCPEP